MELTLHQAELKESHPLKKELNQREYQPPHGIVLVHGIVLIELLILREERDFGKWAKQRIPEILKTFNVEKNGVCNC